MIISVKTTTELTAALKSAQGGDEIRLAPGTYGAVTLQNKDYVSALTITSADPDNPALFTGRLTLNNVSNVVVENLDFRIMQANDPSSNRMIKIDNSENVTIRDIHMEGRITQAGDPGAFNPANGPMTTDAQYNSPIVGFPTGVAVGVQGGKNVVIDRVEIETFGFGISLEDIEDSVISNSHLHNIRMDGIRFTDTRGFVIENNLIENITPFLNEGGSTKYKDHGDSIQFWATYAEFGVIDLTIRGNTLRQGEDGGYTQGIFGRYALLGGQTADQVTLEDIKIHDNIINTGHRNGIYISDAQNVQITNNTLIPPEKDDSLGGTSHVPLIMVTASGAKMADGSFDPKQGETPEDIVVRDNVVVRWDTNTIDSYKISTLSYSTLGFEIDGNSVLSARSTDPNYYGFAYGGMIDGHIDGMEDLMVDPAGYGLVAEGDGVRYVPTWIQETLGWTNPSARMPTDLSGKIVDHVDLGGVTTYAVEKQDRGAAAVSADGEAVSLTGNAWKVLETDISVTKGTVLRLTLDIDTLGEVQGIALGRGTDKVNPEATGFQFAGTQKWGIQDFNLKGAFGDGPRTFEIDLGKYFTGDFDRLVLVSDDDAKAVARTTFSDVEIVQPWQPRLAATDPVHIVTAWDPKVQDFGTATVSADGGDLTLAGNAWKQVVQSMSVTASTVLSFTFEAKAAAEVYAVSFQNSNKMVETTTFQIGGRDKYGLQDYRSYDLGEGQVRYDIEVGRHFTGDFSRVVFIADDDAGRASNATFSDMELRDGLTASEPLLEFSFYNPDQAILAA